MVAAGTWNRPSETANTFQLWKSVGLRIFRRQEVHRNFPRLAAKRCRFVHNAQSQMKLTLPLDHAECFTRRGVRRVSTTTG